MRTKQNKGFTLVEVIVALTILAIVITVFSSLIFTGLRNRNMNREKLEILAQTTSKLDEIKSLKSTWKDIAGLKQWLSDDHFSTSDQLTYTRNMTDSNNVSYTLTITLTSNIGINGLFELRAAATSANVSNISIITRLRGV